MSLRTQTTPPTNGESYIIPQLEGERITIPGSKGVFRILASAKQGTGKISVFQSGAVLSDAPGFHYHNRAHDVFLVQKGFLKLWNGDKCRIMGPGDFAYIPPTIIHCPQMVGPHTETFGLVDPGDWIDFFRYIGETYRGIITPELDDRNIMEHIIGRMKQADRDYDVVFQPKYTPPQVSDWNEEDERIPEGQREYYLKANTGPKWMLGGVMSRPFITTKQSGGKFAMTSLESSKDYGKSIFQDYISFKKVDHCFAVQEGTLVLQIRGGEETELREGETAFIPAPQAFSLKFASKYVRVWTFASGDGIESIIHAAGQAYDGAVLPDEVGQVDAEKFAEAFSHLKVTQD